MRITFLVPHLARISGGVRIICEYARRLAQKGHRVNIISKERRQPIIRNIIHFFINTIKWIDLKEVGVKFVSEFEPKYFPDGDVIFSTSWKTASALDKLSSSKGRKFYFIQGLESILNPTDTQNAEETYYLPFTKITVSSWLQQELLERFNQESELIHNAIDHEELFPQNKIYGTKRIGMLHHTAEYKGFTDGIKAIEIVRKIQPDIKLVIFGTRHRNHENLSLDFEYHQSPVGANLRKIYSSCDIFVCPSWYEGFGLPGLEAMACKCALVTTDNGGCRDYAIDNQTALISSPKDPPKLADNIIKLLSDDKFLMKISQQGYETSQKFRWEDSVNKMEKIICG